MLYSFALSKKNEYPVKKLVETLAVSETGYYKWIKRKEKPTAQQLLLVKIREIIAEYPDNDNYGVK
ncbi:MAG: hypothetical protein ACRCUS_04735, partial [Anaerovoracaceae bacterium]